MTRVPTSPPAPEARRRRRRVRVWYVLFLLFLAFGTLGAATAVGLFMGYVNSLPAIEELEDYNPAQVTVIVDSERRPIAEYSSERRTVVSIAEIPELVRRAFLAIEDSRFREHFGVDLWGVARAVRVNMSGRAREGASTITMQLAQNIDAEYGRRGNWDQKIRETFLAFQIERRYSKDQILEFYLNHIDLGNNSFGVAAAAETYFSKKLDQLTIAEAATLAAIPRSPTYYNPFRRPDRARARRDLVLGRMRDLKWIDEAEYELAVASPLKTRRGQSLANAFNSSYPYFVDALYRDLQSPPYSLPPERIRSDGLVVEATIEPRFQEIAEEELAKGLVEIEKDWIKKNAERYYKDQAASPGGPQPNTNRLARISARPTTDTVTVSLDGYSGQLRFPKGLPYHDPDRVLKPGNYIDVRVDEVRHGPKLLEVSPFDTTKLQGAVVVLDARNGDVLALVGGSDFRDSVNAGQYNRAVQGGKPAGSTIKPFFFAAALERGYTPATTVWDGEVFFPGGGGTSYSPKNYERSYFGDTTLVRALEKSRNVVTVKLFNMLGVKRAAEQVAEFDYRPGDVEWRKKIKPQLAVSLGTVDMTALELAAAYLVFTNQGIGVRPNFFRRIDDRAGRPVLFPESWESIVLDPVSAYQTVYMLRKAVVSGTASSYVGKDLKSPPYPPVCGKTGTTDDNTNVWFAGFTPDIVMVVYVGFDTNRSMGPGMTGGKVAGPVWREIFKRLFPVRDEWSMSFQVPPGVETRNVVDPGSGAIYEGVPFAKEGVPPPTPRPRRTPAATPGPAVNPAVLESL